MVTLCWGCATPAHGASDWVTGRGFQKRLAEPVDVVWAGNPLRSALGNVSQAKGVAVLIDRRVDPDQKLQLELNDVSLETVLRAAAQSRGLGISLLGPVVYFGPPSVSSRLRTISALRTEEAQRLPSRLRRAFLSPEPLSWDDFARPRELLEQLAGQSGITVAGLQLVPHDLWAAADLPPLSLVDRLTLIAVQFDLTFQVGPSGKSVTLVPVPDDVALVRSYPGGGDPEATAERLASLVPGAQVKVAGGKVFVRGLWEDHARIASPRPPRRSEPEAAEARFSNKRFKLKVADQPVGPLLEQLADQLELQLRIDHQGLQRREISLDERVSLNVEDVTIDELLSAVLRPAKLQFRRQGNVVEIRPAE